MVAERKRHTVCSLPSLSDMKKKKKTDLLEMDQWIKSLTSKPGDLSSVPRAHQVDGEI